MPSPTSDPYLADRRVLVVGDACFVADDIAAALRGAGAVVVGLAPSGRAARAPLDAGRVDAAVLDVDLHGEASHPLAGALMARGTPVVFAKRYGKASIPAACRHLPLLEKPFDPAKPIRSPPALIDAA